MNGQPIPRKSLGQHWLTDELSLEAMCDAVQLETDDTVLEIGPGWGTLTQFLVERAGQVIAVEYDGRLAAELPGRIHTDNLQVIEQDILGFDYNQLPAGYKVVANIPYYLTSNLIRVLSETANPATRVALLVQKEVAERVAAKPGDMSILSVTAQYYWEVALGREVPAELFTPPPKVDSQILILERHNQPLLPGVDTKVLFQLVKAGFSQKRKTLLNSLSGGLRISRDDATALLQDAGLQSSARAQTLSLHDWRKLYEAFIQSSTIESIETAP